MPSPSSTTELLDLVRKSGIVGPEALDGRFHEVHGLSGDPVQSAAVLVQKGLITRFQAKLLLTGRYRGFKLGPYVIREQLGQGGMGAVYLAEHEALRRKVALKVLTPPKDDPNSKLTTERFLREARSAAALDHPNIVRIHDVSHQGEVQFLALEYVDGQTLEDLLAKGGPISPSRAVGYIAQAAAGLQHAHEKGFVHRDIKPSNLILAKDGTVKILDMGLARSHNTVDRLTEVMDQGAIVGTADFISPEQAMNAPDIDIRADIYSLGASFFALVAGRPPFSGNTTQKLIQHQMKDAPSLGDIDRTLPPELSAVIARMLAKKPEKRYATPADVITALAPWLGEDGRKVAAGLSTSEAASSSVELQNTMSEIATGGTTRRLNKKSKRLGTADAASNTKVYVAAGAAVAVAAVLVGWAVFGGSEKSGQTTVAVAPPPPAVDSTGKTATTTPKPKPATTKTRTVSASRVAVTGSAVYRFDASLFPTGRFTVRGNAPTSGERIVVPEAYNLHCWSPESTGEFVVEAADGRQALGVANRDGEKVSAQFAIDLTALIEDKLAAGGEYIVRIEYRTTDRATGNVYIQNKKKDWAGIGRFELPDTDGKWTVTTGTFKRDGSDPVQVAVNSNQTETGFVFVRSIEVIDPTADASANSVYAINFTGTSVGSERIERPGNSTDRTALGGAKLPKGVFVRHWHGDASAEYSVADVAGARAVGLRQVTGTTGAQWHFRCEDRLDVLKPGDKVVLRLTYSYDGVMAGGAFVEEKPQNVKHSLTELSATGGEWRTVEIPFTRPAGGEMYDLIIRATKDDGQTVAEGTIWVKSVEVIDPKANAPGVLYSLDLSGQKAFTDRGRTTAVRDQDGDWKSEAVTGEPSLPAGWVRYNWNSETVSEYSAEAIDGQMALGMTHHSGQTSSMLFLPKLAYPSGKVRLRLEYKYDGTAGGPLVRFKQIEPNVATAWDVQKDTLPAGNGTWQTAELDVDLKGATAGYFELHLRGVEPGKPVWFRAVTVSDPAAPPAVKNVAAVAPKVAKAAPVLGPVGKSILAIELKVGKPFKFTVEGGKPSIDPATVLPAGVSCYCWKKESVAEFRGEASDGRFAVGVTNLNDDVSSQVMFGIEDALAASGKPGQKYRVRLEYRTANDAHGNFQVRGANYQPVAGTELANTGGSWKTVEVTFTRGTDKLDTVVQNEAVGEGNTLYVRKFEVFEEK